jgi:hypothetical protein
VASRRPRADAARRPPRNHVPWAIIGACYVVCPLLLLLIRGLLARENRARAAAGPDAAGADVYITVADADGKLVERRVDKVRARCARGVRCAGAEARGAGVPGLDGPAEPRLQICAVSVGRARQMYSKIAMIYVVLRMHEVLRAGGAPVRGRPRDGAWAVIGRRASTPRDCVQPSILRARREADWCGA